MHRAGALEVALRIGGPFVAARDLARAPEVARRMALALVAGVAGALALALLMVALLRALLARDLVAIAAGTFFVHGLVDTFLVFTPLYGLFWLLLALTARRDSRP